jgi:IMP and pyridine-specific 5'-nucleotidase
MTSTKHLQDAPGCWNEDDITELLNLAEKIVTESMNEQNLKGRVIRKRRSVGLVPRPGAEIPREALDETVLRCKTKINSLNDGRGTDLPYCAFNGGSDA